MSDTTQATLDDLTNRVTALETVLQLLAPQIEVLAKNGAELDVYKRYEAGRDNNRAVTLDNELIAVFAHYHFNRNLTPRTISRHRLMSTGKAYALAGWSLQYVHDFLTVHGLMDIYERASEMSELIQKYPAMQKLNDELDKELA